MMTDASPQITISRHGALYVIQGVCVQAIAEQPASVTEHMTLQDAVAQTLSMPAAAQPAPRTITLPDDRAQQLLGQMTAQLSQMQPQAAPGLQTPIPADVQDQSEVIAAQATQLASARQAMQLMLQLLESSTAADSSHAAAAQTGGPSAVAQRSEPAVGPSESDVRDLIGRVQQQLSAQAPALQAVPILVAANQSELVTAQAAELAAARQAMQLLEQLLEQSAGTADVTGADVQLSRPMPSQPVPAGQATGSQMSESSMRQQLQQVLAELQGTTGTIAAPTRSPSGQVTLLNHNFKVQIIWPLVSRRVAA